MADKTVQNINPGRAQHWGEFKGKNGENAKKDALSKVKNDQKALVEAIQLIIKGYAEDLYGDAADLKYQKITALIAKTVAKTLSQQGFSSAQSEYISTALGEQSTTLSKIITEAFQKLSVRISAADKKEILSGIADIVIKAIEKNSGSADGKNSAVSAIEQLKKDFQKSEVDEQKREIKLADQFKSNVVSNINAQMKTFTGLQNKLSKSMSSGINDVINNDLKEFNKVKDISQTGFKDTQKQISKLSSVISMISTGFGIVLAPFKLAFSGLMSLTKSIFAGITGLAGKFLKADWLKSVIMSPPGMFMIGWLAGYVWQKWLSPFMEKWIYPIFTPVQDFFSGKSDLWDTIKNIGSNVSSKLKEALGIAPNRSWSDWLIKDGFKKIWDQKVFSVGDNAILGGMKSVLNSIQGLVQYLPDKVKPYIPNLQTPSGSFTVGDILTVLLAAKGIQFSMSAVSALMSFGSFLGSPLGMALTVGTGGFLLGKWIGDKVVDYFDEKGYGEAVSNTAGTAARNTAARAVIGLGNIAQQASKYTVAGKAKAAALAAEEAAKREKEVLKLTERGVKLIDKGKDFAKVEQNLIKAEQAYKNAKTAADAAKKTADAAKKTAGMLTKVKDTGLNAIAKGGKVLKFAGYGANAVNAGMGLYNMYQGYTAEDMNSLEAQNLRGLGAIQMLEATGVGAVVGVPAEYMIRSMEESRKAAEEAHKLTDAFADSNERILRQSKQIYAERLAGMTADMKKDAVVKDYDKIKSKLGELIKERDDTAEQIQKLGEGGLWQWVSSSFGGSQVRLETAIKDNNRASMQIQQLLAKYGLSSIEELHKFEQDSEHFKKIQEEIEIEKAQAEKNQQDVQEGMSNVQSGLAENFALTFKRFDEVLELLKKPNPAVVVTQTDNRNKAAAQSESPRMQHETKGY